MAAAPGACFTPARMKPLLDYGLLVFVSMFTMMGPVGVLPPFVSMTSGLSGDEARRVARRATITALCVLLVFALGGQLVFRFFNISVNSLRVVGGIILLLVGYEMLQARPSRTKHDEPAPEGYAEDIAITPLGIPVIAGPGAITTVIILMSEAHDLARKAVLLVVLLGLHVLTYAMLVSAKPLLAFLGPSGNKVLVRIMGLIVMVIAVEFFFAGLKPIVRDMLGR